MTVAQTILAADDRLVAALAPLRFAVPVHLTYQPLVYARAVRAAYLERFARVGIKVLFIGMNPGPFGMTQTGIPFGEIEAVRDWLGLAGPVAKPSVEHPKRPIQGFSCPRSEVSGRRLWGLFRQRFTTPEAFFAGHFVENWCPLVFMDEGGANLTPDKLPAAERLPLEAACDAQLATVIATLKPQWVIGIGGFARDAAERVVAANKLTGVQVGTILHPSPASPAANRDWPGQATKQLTALGIWA